MSLVSQAPLAYRLRPTEWEEFAGLSELDPHLVSQLRAGQGRPPSLILWGPPGSGKTTLAKLIGGSFDCDFEELSAVLVGVKQVRDVIAAAKGRSRFTLLFLDEIHRFNKAQQDAFLPHVENGTIVLVGATTENPSFYLTGALLSRCRVLTLPALSSAALKRLCERGASELELNLASDAIDEVVGASGGDARLLFNLLEALSASAPPSGAMLDPQAVRDRLRSAGVFQYDQSGEAHFNMASAFIKSLRGSSPDGALFWCFRMIEAGEDPRFLIRRMIIFASEDIGNADPRALTLAVATAEAFDRVGLPEGRIPLAQCVTYLASAPKSNRSYVAMNRVLSASKKHPAVSVPKHLRNAPTGLMGALGYGDGYQYPHDLPAGYAPGVQYLPDQLSDSEFYEPSQHGLEARIKERLDRLRALG